MPINAIYDQFEEIRDQIQEILDGHRTLSLFCGPPGIGKTFTVELMLRAAGIKNLRPVTANDAPSFVKLLWDHQEQPAVFLDDCDALATKSECAMIAKKAFGPDRRVVWDSTAARNNQLKGGATSLFLPLTSISNAV
jgi:hypothetical protein